MVVTSSSKMSYVPLVSVIIPVFNRREMLDEAFASVIGQTYEKIECIIVDDGSTDEAMVRYKGDERAAYIRLPRSGVSAARNCGIRHSGGELIAFLDSDDLWQPEKIEAQVAYFMQNPHMLIAQTEEIWIRHGRRVNPKRIHKKRGGYIFPHCLARCIVSPSAVMMRRRFFDEVGCFDPSLPACEDYDLWLRAAARYPVGLINRPLTVKRGGHADQLSRRHSLDGYRIRSLARLLDSRILNVEQSRQALDEMQRKSRIYAAGCRKRGRMSEADRIESLAKTFTGGIYA